MSVIALLSWYEEQPGWLAECVASVAKLCDHIIAVDGPYALFPGALRRPASGTDQAETILRTAAGAGIGCTIHAPRRPWWGNEVEKRDHMFRLGGTFAEPGDWFLRIDADEVLSDVPADTAERLGASDANVAEVLIWDRDGGQHPFRCLFRALPGLRIEQAHYVVTAMVDGQRRVLCGNSSVHDVEPAEQLLDVRLEHRTQQRSPRRWALKHEYWAARADLDTEALHPLGRS